MTSDRDARVREQIAYLVKCAAFNQPLMGADWTRPENRRWLDTADRILAALAQRATPDACQSAGDGTCHTHGGRMVRCEHADQRAGGGA